MPATLQKRRPTRRPATSLGGKASHHAPPSVQCDAATQVMMGLARRDPAVWLETYGRIVDKNGDLIKPKVNALQRRVHAVWNYCQAHDLPCSIIVCKPRQGGSSTGAIGLGYHIVQSAPSTTRMRVIGGKYKQVQNLWKILQTYAHNDECVWPRGRMEVLDTIARAKDCEITQETARDPDAGRSGTFRVVIVTELGRWMENGVANAAKVLSGFLACCPRKPGTLRLIESTAQGMGGEFQSRYAGAVTFEQFRAGLRGNGFVRVFAAWFEFDDYTKDLTPDEAAALEADLDEEERQLRERYDLTLGQLAWRRETIGIELDGDAELFKQEYPSNEEEAFLSSGRPRFSRSGLERQRVVAERAREMLETGDLSISDDFKVSWQSLPEDECVLHRYEAPVEGRQYLIALDVARGEEQAEGETRDCHSVPVIRRDYYDEHGEWHPPALAMRIRPPRKGYKFACRWESDLLEETVYRMALYYGNCLIVPEMNLDIGIVTGLKRRRQIPGAPVPRIYSREVFNEKEERKTKLLGWMTTAGNRESIISGLATAIRETGEPGKGIELRCAHTLAECVHFERGSSGKSEAASGWHDDDVMAWAIGLACLEQATTFREPRARRVDPPEVRLIAGHGKKRRPGMYS